MFLPKGILIAGTERDLNSANDLRFLRRTLPNNVSLLLWPAILRRAEHKVAYKTLISFPCIPENILGPGQDAFDSNIHTEIAGRLYGWTGFSSPYLNPLEHWKTVLSNAEEKIDQFHRGRDDDHDEERLMIMRFKGRTLGRAYYKLGKYARDEDEYRQLRTVLPDIEGYATPRSWETLGEKLRAGYEDTQAFVEAGSAACSVDELSTVIDHILMTRRGLVSEPEWFYRRVLTFGFLKTRLVGSDLNEILKLARWIKGDQD